MNIETIKERLNRGGAEISKTMLIADFGDACHKYMELLNKGCYRAVEEAAEKGAFFPEEIDGALVGTAVIRAARLTDYYINACVGSVNAKLIETAVVGAKPDLVIIDNEVIHIIDYKFGVSAKAFSECPGLFNALDFYKARYPGIVKYNLVLINVLSDTTPIKVKRVDI